LYVRQGGVCQAKAKLFEQFFRDCKWHIP